MDATSLKQGFQRNPGVPSMDEAVGRISPRSAELSNALPRSRNDALDFWSLGCCGISKLFTSVDKSNQS
jgi:hypothetical protein